MAKVFQPDAERLRELGYGAVANVPVIFDRDNALCREHSRYLRDRAVGQWSPVSTAAKPRRTKIVAQRTLKLAADSLSVWIDWCETQQQDWRTVAYEDVLTFQNSMLHGTWSPSGRKLSPATANRRADEATAFLEWAGVKQLRTPFTVPRTTSSHNFSTGKSSVRTRAEHTARIHRAKQSRTGGIEAISLLPEPQEVVDWLARVLELRGPAKYLAAKFILETGTRLEETVSIVTDQIPSMATLRELQGKGRSAVYVPLTITKGSVPREIPVAIDFLIELRHWIDTRRQTMAYRYSRRTGQKASNLLFISDSRGHEGIPISRATLYKLFTTVHPRPRKWHPHFGRHAYACFNTLHSLRSEAAAAGSTLEGMGVDWINSRGSFHLKMLQRNLGHLDEKTTELYLRWLATAAGVDETYASWHAFLDSGEL